MRFLILLVLLALPGAIFSTTTAADSRAINLHQGLGEQNRAGRLFWRGGVEMRFDDPRFGGISAMHVETGGRTAYMITDKGELAEVILEYNTAGNLTGAALEEIRPITGAGGRGISSAIEAIAKMPDGGWLVAYERKHRLMHFPRSIKPLQTTPRLLNTPVGLERARSLKGVEAATETHDRKILLVAEDMPTTRGFTFAWLGDGARWTPMSYALFPPYKPVGAALLSNGDILMIERRGTPRSPAGTRFAKISKRQLRPGAPIQTREVARLEPPFVTANFEAIAVSQGLQGQSLIYVASDNEFSSSRPTTLLMFELLP
ncbi:MAG: hypothetical protein HOJ90_11265 [Alphaproteobacteria bacterium]|jgi:hypothetical protein|nr:hypothetical protein [Alphaproteobacteria bacterium]